MHAVHLPRKLWGFYSPFRSKDAIDPFISSWMLCHEVCIPYLRWVRYMMKIIIKYA
jgi:hypothetical protein